MNKYKCPDCKGSGVYQGLGAPEDCQTCDGAGSFIGIQVDTANDIYPEGTKKEGWDELSESFVRNARKICEEADSVTHIHATSKAGMSPQLMCGDIIHVYDAGWIEGVLQNIEPTKDGVGKVILSYTCGSIRFPKNHLTFNLTESRWEYIRSGTPVW